MGETATIYLVRHAQADDAGDDPGLSASGVVQARALATKLRTRGVALILHSPRRRAVETAEIIVESVQDIEIRALDLLDDRTPYPSAANRSGYSERFLQWVEGVAEPERDVDGVVIGSALDELVEIARARAHRGATVAVTHNFVIGGMLPRIIDAPVRTWTRFDSANAGVSRIECGDAGMRLVSFNEPLD